MQQQMEGMGKVAQVEFGESINSAVRRFDARLGDQANDHATSLNGWFKSEGMSKVHPCLSFGADGRNLGVGTKAEQPPVTKSEHKMDMGTDSISTEKEKPTQQLKTEQIPNQQLKMEQTPTQKLKAEQIPEPRGANGCDQNDWWGSMGFNWHDPCGWGQYRPMLPPKGNYAKGESHRQRGRT